MDHVDVLVVGAGLSGIGAACHLEEECPSKSYAVLVVGNRYDPATPYRNAVLVHDLLPNSTLLTVDGVGHGAVVASSCATSLVSQYLLTGATPPAGTVCTQDRGAFDPVPASALTSAVRTGLAAG